MICGVLALLSAWSPGEGDGGWSASGTLEQWEYGVPAGGSAPVWSTRLDEDTFNDTTEVLEIPVPATTGVTRPVAVLTHHYALGTGDTASLQLDDGDGFEPIAPLGGYPAAGTAFVGSSAGSVQTGVLLPELPTGGTLRLVFTADAVGAGEGWTLEGFELWDGDPLPPRIRSIAGPGDTQDLLGPYRFEADILEDALLLGARVVYDVGSGEQIAPMALDGDVHVAELPGLPPDTELTWRVEAEDCNATSARSGDPFRVFLAAPTALRGPDGPHGVSQAVTLTWEPPVSPWPVTTYEVRDLGSGTTHTTGATGLTLDLMPGAEQRFEVRAIYDTPFGARAGDPSVPVDLAIEVPEIASLDPVSAFPGESLYVELTGRSLYLLEGVSSVRVLPDLTVGSLEVRDVDRATLLLEVPADAPPSLRDVEISSPRGVFRFDAVFGITDGALAPRILRVEPDSLVQGGEATVRFTSSRAFGESVTVLLDDDLLQVGEPSVSGDQVEVPIVAIGRARPGPHAVILDDGTRLYSADLTVTEYRIPTRSGCSAAPGVPTGLPGAAILLGIAIVLGGHRRASRCRLAPICETP